MIRFIDIRYFAGSSELLNGLSWHVKPGERVGLVGDNGTGKTTLLRLAAGEARPDAGEVVARRGARIGYLRQEIRATSGDGTVLFEAMKAFEREQRTGAEIQLVYERLHDAAETEHAALLERAHALEKHVFHHDAGGAEADTRKTLAGLGFSDDDFSRPLAEFSGGWQMRAQIARLLLERPDLLMLDEPTNHLDLESIQWLEGFLSGFAGALIVVSHDRFFLDRVTTRTAWLWQKRMRSYSGNYSRFLTQREMEEEQLSRQYDNQRREIARIQEFVDRFRCKATKAAGVQSRLKMLERMELVELPPGSRRARLRFPDPAPCGRRVLELRGMSKAYDGNRVFHDVNLVVEKGDKIALIGPNGAGKSTLLKICAGVLDYEGARLPDPRAQTEYFSQHRIDTLNPENTVIEEARPPGASQTDEQLRALLGCFLFSGDDVLKPVGVLSGGEKSRLALARLMLRRGNLLLLDEPTNHLDMSTREILQKALRDFPGTLVMISHDRYFIDAVANKIVEVGGGSITLYLGNYTDYLYRKGAGPPRQTGANEEVMLRGRGARHVQKPAVAPSAFHPAGAIAAIHAANLDRKESRRAGTQRRQQWMQQRRELRAHIQELLRDIGQMETRLTEIHALQADPGAYASGRITPEIAAEGRALEKNIPDSIAQWEALVEEYDQTEKEPD
ncbi:MAG: ABC-F family ATP-binding cassette domain-containing protein [Candidatus Sumerlaeota bacterium]|nr:ABC-F family ATP-binding cassette domain-containing protein [Candidatus Sumerlaeota bacterium]